MSKIEGERSFLPVNIAVMTVSDTRTLDNDKSGQTLVKRLYHGFEDALLVRAIGSISQAYDGNPPHEPRGAISHATSVASLLRIGEMIDQFE